MEHHDAEMAGLATRIEAIEREIAAEKSLGQRTPGGLLIPKTVKMANTQSPSTGISDLLVSKLLTRMDRMEEALLQAAKVIKRQQNDIEELALMAD